jgi:hypothetical protein
MRKSSITLFRAATTAGGRCRKVIVRYAPIHEPAAANEAIATPYRLRQSFEG